MASSSRLSSIVELNSVEIKSETLVSSTDPTEHLKCLYNYLFHDVQPSNEQKLRILNDIIVEATIPDELRTHHMKRAQIYFNMRDWNNVLHDINQIEQYGELDKQMFILKIKAVFQYDLEKAQQILAERRQGEYLQLTRTINQMKEILERTDETTQSSNKRFRSEDV